MVNRPVIQATRVSSLGWEDPQEEEMATHYSILAWRISMEREAWQATVHEVAKSWTWRVTEQRAHMYVCSMSKEYCYLLPSHRKAESLWSIHLTLGKHFLLSKPHFPCLHNGDDNSVCLTDLCQGLHVLKNTFVTY